MSYDVSLMAETGGEAVQVWDRNHTSNTSAMWRAAGCDIAEFHGRKPHYLGSAAAHAFTEIYLNRENYRPMQPDNGWGTVESTLDFLAAISLACEKYPMTTVDVSR